MRKVIEWTGQPGFNGRNFASYRHPKTGKAMMWIDEYGEKQPDGISIARAKVYLSDKEGEPGFQPRATEIVAYLKDHPYMRDRQFIIRDLDAEEEARNTVVKNKADVLFAYYTLGEQDLRKVLTIGKLDASGSFLDLHGRIQAIADSGEKGVKRLHDIMATQDKEYRIVLQFAINDKLIFYKNNRYYLGSEHGEVIGFDEDAVIFWMKNNEKEYSYLVKQTETTRIKKGVKSTAPELKGEAIQSENIANAEKAMANMSFEDEQEEAPTRPPLQAPKSYLEQEEEMDPEDMLMAAKKLEGK